MKKSYVYFVAPLAALLVFFFGFYWNAHRDYEGREQAKVKQANDSKRAKLEKEAKDREVAVKSAVELQEKRRVDKKARDERESKEKEEREKARQARDKAGRDADKLEQQAKRLAKEIDAEKRELAEVQVSKKRTEDEYAFQKQYVSKAEANSKNLASVLEKIAAADKAAEEAARAAAIAAAAAAAAKK
jgi:colicin import membrane protein